MSATSKGLAFLAALLVGALVAIDRSQGGLVVHAQDFLLWIFGLLCFGGGLYKLVKQRDTFNWRLGLWLVIGAIAIFGELGNVYWIKEATCHFIYPRQYPWDGPCYLPS